MEQNNWVADFLNFDKMITPTLIKIIYIILVALQVIAGFGMIISGFNYAGYLVLVGLAVIGLSPFIPRIFCEILIIQFKNNEYLKKIAEK